jgi:hypothetical protein
MTRALGSDGFVSQNLILKLQSQQAADSISISGGQGRRTLHEDRTDALLSAALIIGVPVLFWLGVFEITSAAAGISYGFAERVAVAGALIVFLGVIRGCAREASRS